MSPILLLLRTTAELFQWEVCPGMQVGREGVTGTSEQTESVLRPAVRCSQRSRKKSSHSLFFYRCQSGFLKISILNARWLMKVRQATFIICHYEFSCVPLLGIDG